MPKPDKGQIGSLARKRRANWDQRWSKDDFAPFWLGADFPSEMNSFLERGWFNPKGRILDIGCGRGELAAGLASHGHSVVGVDFSSAAIQKAKNLYGKTKVKLNFKCLDVCGPRIRDLESFDYLIDRGCLHSIPKTLWGPYAKNLQVLSKPSTKLLILHKKDELSAKQLRDQISGILNAGFQEVGVSDIKFGQAPDNIPGLALEYTRKN